MNVASITSIEVQHVTPFAESGNLIFSAVSGNVSCDSSPLKIFSNNSADILNRLTTQSAPSLSELAVKWTLTVSDYTVAPITAGNNAVPNQIVTTVCIFDDSKQIAAMEESNLIYISFIWKRNFFFIFIFGFFDVLLAYVSWHNIDCIVSSMR